MLLDRQRCFKGALAVLLLDCSFAETCISGILSSQSPSLCISTSIMDCVSSFPCEQASLLNFMIRVAIKTHLL